MRTTAFYNALLGEEIEQGRKRDTKNKTSQVVPPKESKKKLKPDPNSLNIDALNEARIELQSDQSEMNDVKAILDDLSDHLSVDASRHIKADVEEFDEGDSIHQRSADAIITGSQQSTGAHGDRKSKNGEGRSSVAPVVVKKESNEGKLENKPSVVKAEKRKSKEATDSVTSGTDEEVEDDEETSAESKVQLKQNKNAFASNPIGLVVTTMVILTIW
jgi:hypothetical protein